MSYTFSTPVSALVGDMISSFECLASYNFALVVMFPSSIEVDKFIFPSFFLLFCFSLPATDVSGTTREQINQCTGSASEGNQKTSKVEIVELSDDEQDFKTEIGNATLEDVNSSVWYFMTSHGLKGGPYRMSSLKKCFDDMDKDLNFKVWKKGQTMEEAILLEDAIRQNFPDT